jgi:hypothetical protein
MVSLNHEEVEAKMDLWTSFDRSVHHFNLSIDLNACTCGACVPLRMKFWENRREACFWFGNYF